MSHDWSGSATKTQTVAPNEDRFSFWSRAELTRVGLIVALAAVPVSLSLLEPPPATAKGANVARPAATQAGGLRAVRVVALDLKTLTSKALADAD